MIHRRKVKTYFSPELHRHEKLGTARRFSCGNDNEEPSA